jgi:hypothetical protein
LAALLTMASNNGWVSVIEPRHAAPPRSPLPLQRFLGFVEQVYVLDRDQA